MQYMLSGLDLFQAQRKWALSIARFTNILTWILLGIN